jgi:acyl-CoA reductase-like NAD-dependent aldehyde dehydrogenase
VRDVLAENGIDPNLVSLAVTSDPKATQALATNPSVRSIDFTGSSSFGRWLIDNARQAQVYAELAGVNNVVIESTDNYKAMLKNLAFTLSLYSGQMCTTTQDIFVPAASIPTKDIKASMRSPQISESDREVTVRFRGRTAVRIDSIAGYVEAHRRSTGVG